jgi:hypothetical protein
MAEPLHEQHDRRKGDPEADERNVRCEREGLHLPGLLQIVLFDRLENAGRESSDGNEHHPRPYTQQPQNFAPLPGVNRDPTWNWLTSAGSTVKPS